MLNIIVVSRRLRSSWSVDFGNRRQVAIAGAALALLLGLVAAGGMILGHQLAGGAAALDPLRAEVEQARQTVDQARAEAKREVNAMAARLVELQAQANRINALGQRLAEQGQLQGEFDFAELPGMGGPELPSGATPEFSLALGEVESEFSHAKQQLDLLAALLEGREAASAALPSRMPAPGYISSPFGPRPDPFTGARSHHFGVDIDANIGDPIHAAADGIVTFSGIQSGFGVTVVIDHGNGYETLYAHNQRNLVRVGDVVRAGQQIATVGSSGRSTGSHLHFEVHVNGRPVDPRAYLARVRG